jgi:UDP-N-acetylmuramoyl-tripeptide--D-alanyl-D-alanine ligase
MSWTAGELAEWCGGELSGDARARVSGVSTDTRALARGELFAALRGENFDGHRFVPAALAAGAAALLVSEKPEADPGVPVIHVVDTVRALGDLARGHRARFSGPVVAITGSNGKTTTKELCAAILEAAGQRVRRTPGNLNNHIGLPLSMLLLSRGDAALVVEMGMNHPGEIDYLAGIASPTAAAITNVAPAHLGPMGSIEAIARAKGEIFDRLRPDGTAVVNLDDARVVEQARRFAGRRLGFGRAPAADFRAEQVAFDAGRPRFELLGPPGRAAVRMGIAGAHLVEDALCAAAAAWATGLLRDLRPIAAALEGFAGVPGRAAERVSSSGVRVIDDTYNANPHSVAAALRTLAALRGAGRAFAVLGDMWELGDEAEALHAACGAQAARAGVDALIGLGPLSAHLLRGAREAGLSETYAAQDPADAAARVRERARAGDVVLIKGSRGMQMERVVHALLETDRD